MPDTPPLPRPAQLDSFEPKALRTTPDERQRTDDWMERVLSAHPAWPWPLIEEEARRQAKEGCRQPGSSCASPELTPDRKAEAE